MRNIEVLFQLDAKLEAALSMGQYERVGGVIRHSQTKQVVMWLQETGDVIPEEKITKGLLASVLQRTGMSSPTMGLMLSRSVPALNIAMSGYSLYLMIERVRELEKQIEMMHEQISAEFARDRRIDFEASLENARDVIDAENEIFKQQAANRAIDQLYRAQQQRLTDYDSIISEAPSVDLLQRAQHYLLQAMMTSTMRVRCYLETDQIKTAKSRLDEAIDVYYARTVELIRRWLGESPAMYFNAAISDEDFSRFLNIEAWVRNIENVLPLLVQEYRGEFWNKDAIKPLSITSFNLPFRSRSETDEPSYITALKQAELLIENFHRLVGFKEELASLRLSFKDWETYTDDIETDEGYVLLVDRDVLEATERLSI